MLRVATTFVFFTAVSAQSCAENPSHPECAARGSDLLQKNAGFKGGTQLNSSKLSSEVRQPGLFDQPRILWLHLHSYGGTTMCSLARANGEKAPSNPLHNCNIVPDWCSTPKSSRVSCRERADSHRFTFSAIERAVDEDDLKCSASGPTLLFGIMFRDPVAAMKSTLIESNFDRNTVLRTLRSRVAPRNLATHRCLPPFDTFQHFDNFAVRSLSNAYNVPVGAVSRRHLERAKGVLSKLDVVLIMEELDEHLPQLRAVFGWKMDPDRNVQQLNSHEIPMDVFSAEEVQFLKHMNHLDYELYAFARSLAGRLTSEANQRLVEQAAASRKL